MLPCSRSLSLSWWARFGCCCCADVRCCAWLRRSSEVIGNSRQMASTSASPYEMHVALKVFMNCICKRVNQLYQPEIIITFTSPPTYDHAVAPVHRLPIAAQQQTNDARMHQIGAVRDASQRPPNCQAHKVLTHPCCGLPGHGGIGNAIKFEPFEFKMLLVVLKTRDLTPYVKVLYVSRLLFCLSAC